MKDEHIPDVAIQVHTVRRAGLAVDGADVMVLDRACACPDLRNLFRREDVGGPLSGILPDVPRLVNEQLAMLAGAMPQVAPGPQCSKPYPCPFTDRCNGPLPAHHVSTLHGCWHRVPEFVANHWDTIDKLPDDLPLNPTADRQRRAVKAGRMLVEGDLAGALRRFDGPLAYLDFETINPAVPVWDGCHPYDAIPVQFSCHREGPDGSLAHVAWLADGPEDPRAEMARRVIEACRGARAVVAYNMSFERACLGRLMQALPDQAEELGDIAGRLVDPLPVLREHVYHPDFGGSFSLKAVAPVLAPELDYAGLDIAEGDTASRVLARLLFAPDVPPEERMQQRTALLRYCENDTRALVLLIPRLRDLAAAV